eukprot:Phypoly_transcript_08966.p1 GENE.Phypoly_transcript_08966~~Phypoly_transcript_08966.p1  ORF type:complete len:121 (+),score=12.72 Phypoly_transcript_08966:133-495(+)
MVLTTSKSACFASVQFALDTNISVKQKKELKEAITSHGGIISDFITPKVHLLVSEGEGGYKRYTASRLQTQIVSVNYVKTCISSACNKQLTACVTLTFGNYISDIAMVKSSIKDFVTNHI